MIEIFFNKDIIDVENISLKYHKLEALLNYDDLHLTLFTSDRRIILSKVIY